MEHGCRAPLVFLPVRPCGNLLPAGRAGGRSDPGSAVFPRPCNMGNGRTFHRRTCVPACGRAFAGHHGRLRQRHQERGRPPSCHCERGSASRSAEGLFPPQGVDDSLKPAGASRLAPVLNGFSKNIRMTCCVFLADVYLHLFHKILCGYMVNQKALLLSFLAMVSPTASATPPSLEILSKQDDLLLMNARDRENRSWVLETSSDLLYWQPEGRTLHVRNSELPVSLQFSPEKMPANVFYRLAALPSGPARTSSHMLRSDGVYDYALKSMAPAHLAKFFGRVVIDNKKAALGRVLFHDRRLSKDNSISCASCHQPEHAFSDSAARSTGHHGGLTKRNSISLQHVRSYVTGGGFFWDGRTTSLESAVIEPISYADEMGLPMNVLLGKIAAEPYYRELFSSAYPSQAPTAARVGEALADFIESTVSFRSKYDVQAAFQFGNFSSQEKQGMEIFSTHCASCHPLGTFTSGGFANNGLDLQSVDKGRGGLKGLEADEGLFRIPSLRQVGLTAPYMHDGRFATLREVIEFYDHKVKDHPKLSKPLTTKPLGLREDQKLALEKFLQTLTDTSALADPAYSDPFRND
ncbi:MAG: hypothetical protein EOP87_06985 [Verrucomicrobiaceae bacterium]|nr:MAG: hypothetical protein EOP87_06985 [Verrucomicrobiaceae bacterium]